MDGKQRYAMVPEDVPLSTAVLRLLDEAANESAQRRHEYIGTEHLVLALSRSAGDSRPLTALAVEPQRVYARIDGIVQRGATVPNPELVRPITSRTKRAFELAGESARQLGHTHLDTAHLLVGLLREERNIGAQVLADEGLTVDRAAEYARRSGAA